MELQWNKTACPYLHTIIRQVQSVEETMELRLPEELPDIGRVLSAWGQCVVRSKQWRGDGMQASGGVTVSVLYVPEDGSAPRCVESWLPFQAKWNFPQTRREGVMRISSFLRAVDARTLSARKMMLRANMDLVGEVFEPTEAEIFTPGELPPGIEVLTNVYPAVLPREAGEKQFTLEEELHVPDVEKWVHFSAQPELTEMNVVGSRVVMRGSAHVSYLYLDERGNIHTGKQDIPFAQFADLDRDYDQKASADVQLCVSSIEPEQEGKSTRIQCVLVAQYLIKDQSLLEIAEDAYSPICRLELNVETLKLPMELENREEILEAEPLFHDGKVMEMTFLPEAPSQYREGEMIHLELSGQFRLLYEDAQGEMRSGTENWNASRLIPAAEATHLKPLIESVDNGLDGGRMKICLQTWTDQQIPMITGLTVGERKSLDSSRPSLILRPMDADSLWELAKENGSTMDAIRKANHLTQEPHHGQLLLIPVI